MVLRPRGRPPRVISSKPVIPVGIFSERPEVGSCFLRELVLISAISHGSGAQPFHALPAVGRWPGGAATFGRQVDRLAKFVAARHRDHSGSGLRLPKLV